MPHHAAHARARPPPPRSPPIPPTPRAGAMADEYVAAPARVCAFGEGGAAHCGMRLDEGHRSRPSAALAKISRTGRASARSLPPSLRPRMRSLAASLPGARATARAVGTLDHAAASGAQAVGAALRADPGLARAACRAIAPGKVAPAGSAVEWHGYASEGRERASLFGCAAQLQVVLYGAQGHVGRREECVCVYGEGREVAKGVAWRARQERNAAGSCWAPHRTYIYTICV